MKMEVFWLDDRRPGVSAKSRALGLLAAGNGNEELLRHAVGIGQEGGPTRSLSQSRLENVSLACGWDGQSPGHPLMWLWPSGARSWLWALAATRRCAHAQRTWRWQSTKQR